jgi:serine/threonine-protein kinase HipA
MNQMTDPNPQNKSNVFEHLTRCPGTLSVGHSAYSRTALKRMFDGKLVSPILPYLSPFSDEQTNDLFNTNRERLSISGVQDKYSVLLEKNKLRLIHANERGQFILKPPPRIGKHAEEMPANEHLTMQIARQVFGIETAENALVFFQDGTPAYLTKRFDYRPDNSKWAQEDFASLAGLTPQTHGTNYKYQGNYLELFKILQRFVPAYAVEAPKLFKLILFNYLLSNGDAHYKNFSLIETELGDFKLSPAYDLLNSRMHISDTDFALNEGLLPPRYAKGKIHEQFHSLGKMAELPEVQVKKIFDQLTSQSEKVTELINQSYLSERFKRNYTHAYTTRLAKLIRG